jgi:hypothetical protein
MDIDRGMNILSGLKYHNYALLIVHMDADRFGIGEIEKNIRASYGGKRAKNDIARFCGPTEIFRDRCLEYRNYLKAVLNKFMQALDIGSEVDFGAFMYKPSCFMSFGDNDNIAFVAVDEFDAAARLSSLEDLRIRQTCLAFCPELKSLGLKNDEYEGILCELADIYVRKTEEGEKPTSNNLMQLLKMLYGEQVDKIDVGEVVDPLAFFEKRPLMAVTYFKLSGMAILGPGLMMQEYVYKVMAEKIRDTLKELAAHADDFPDILPNGISDIESFRCMFLDPQGWSDIATLMFSRNYSVTATVIAALRSLIFEEMYDKSQVEVQEGKRGSEVTLEEAVRSFGVHKAFADIIDNEAAAGSLLRKNHIFCSTYTALSVHENALKKTQPPALGEAYYYNGVVIADTNLNVCSGHVLDVKDEAERRNKAIAQFRIRPKNISDKYLWYLVGHNDYVYQQLANEKLGIDQAVNVLYLIQQMKSIWEEPADKDAGRHHLGRDIQDICTDLRIPIPVLPTLMRKVDENEHIELRHTLYALRTELFENEGGRFHMKKLNESMNILRVPSPLSSGIMYLYTDFANYLSDTLLFDSVLDLYDIFTALYRLLTKELPDSLKERLYERLRKQFGEKKSNRLKRELFRGDDDQKNLCGELKDDPRLRADLDAICLHFLSANDLEDLVELTELIQNALSNRVQISFSAAERWNVTIDARGIGLDRIISAADVPLKCGLGMLRKVMNRKDMEKRSSEKLTEEEKVKINAENMAKIGGASKITCNARAFSKRLVVGDIRDVFLASVDLNIAHLTRPRSFYIHLHETAHLISYLLRGKCEHGTYECATEDVCCYKKLTYKANELNDIYLERYQEIFAEMLVHKLVFDGDCSLFLRNYVANYSLDPIAFTANDDQTTKCMVEVLIRGFLASEPCRRKELYSEPRELTEEVIEKVSTDFWNSIENVGPFLNDYSRLWCGPKKEKTEYYVKEQFKRVFRAAYYPVCCIWGEVQKIFGIVTDDFYPSITDQIGDTKHEGLDRQINEGLNNGTPLIRVQYRGKRGNRQAMEDERLDALYLICRLLREHISNLYGKIDTKNSMVYLCRKTNGKPDALALQEGKRWNLRLLDRNFNGIVAADPWTRRKSMRDRIAIIKTLWDISTNLRARRMNDMLSAAKKDRSQ